MHGGGQQGGPLGLGGGGGPYDNCVIKTSVKTVNIFKRNFFIFKN